MKWGNDPPPLTSPPNMPADQGEDADVIADMEKKGKKKLMDLRIFLSGSYSKKSCFFLSE